MLEMCVEKKAGHFRNSNRILVSYILSASFEGFFTTVSYTLLNLDNQHSPG